MNLLRRRVIFALPCAIAAAGVFYFALAPKMKTAQTKTLTFAERVAYQRAIEEVYWQHRIWPNEHASKPSLNQVMSQAQIEKKVADYLCNSKALEDYWQRPLTAPQLQAEMDRMAQHTKQPEVLRQLFAALGNDPFVIAECLARPVLAERLVTHWFAYDERFHGELKRRAQAELQAGPTLEQMKQSSGTYSEIEFIKDEQGNSPATAPTLNKQEWEQTVARVSQGKPGAFSPLREDDSSYYAIAAIEKTSNGLKLARVTWQKESFKPWRDSATGRIISVLPVPSNEYSLPDIAEGSNGCIDDTWTATFAPPNARSRATAVWTGSEMIVWGGVDESYTYLATGNRYNPSTDTWTATPTTNAPPGRYSHTAVWTGSEMIVWGGISNGGLITNTGGKYDPSADVWNITTTANAPTARFLHTAVWTGAEMVVWGGLDPGNSNGVDTGGKYNPGTDVWTSTSTINAASGRAFHSSVWTGSEMIVWAGSGANGITNTGGRYDPSADSWIATSITNAPTPRLDHTAVWSGSEMIIWGGYDASNDLNSGGRYDPTTDSWIVTSTTNAPEGRSLHTAVWTGSDIIVWGGRNYSTYLNSGGRYNPGTDSWAATNIANAPSGRDFQSAVWTGSEMIVWGGADDTYVKDDGARYDPLIDSWTSVTFTPTSRNGHTAVWTGTQMIIWGGFIQDGGVYSNSGAKYSPATDDWTATTSILNAPTGRANHSAIWTGSEMIVWGGNISATTFTNTGGRYNPDADSWTATSTTNAPTARMRFTRVWTGTEMIVWGGYDIDFLNTGGRYNPETDSWIATSTNIAPTARWAHTAVWTGSEMIVWGGYDRNGFNNSITGGRYNPNTDGWTATNTTNVPSGRYLHAAVWTGSDMIVWGGTSGGLYLNTGGRYNPGTDSWAPTSTTNAPLGRAVYDPLWTGNEMIVWGGNYLDSGGRYSPNTDSWSATSTVNAPAARSDHTAVWTGTEMIVWGGTLSAGQTNTGGRYCAQSPSPTATPTPTPKPSPTPTPRPTPTPTPVPVRVAVSAAPTQINEGQSATYTVTASSTVTRSIAVHYAMSGTATNGSDYLLTGTAGQVTIPSGQSSGTVTLKSKADHVTEGTETAIMTLQPGSGYRVGNPKQATVSILDSP